MNKKEIVKRVLENKGGIAKTADFTAKGMKNYDVAALCKEGRKLFVAGNRRMDYETMANKTFIYSILRKLLEAGKLDSATLSVLCNPDECKRLFCFSGKFSVLKEVSPLCTNEEVDKVCYDEKKRRRYYNDKITVDGKSYVVCNHWYGSNKSKPDNRTPFLQWAEQKF